MVRLDHRMIMLCVTNDKNWGNCNMTNGTRLKINRTITSTEFAFLGTFLLTVNMLKCLTWTVC